MYLETLCEEQETLVISIFLFAPQYLYIQLNETIIWNIIKLSPATAFYLDEFNSV